MATHANHYEETRASFRFNAQQYEEIHKADGTHILILRDNGEVWFYYSADFRLIMVRVY